MKYVLDSSAFINLERAELEGDIYTTPEIVKEIKDLRTKSMLNALDIIVKKPEKKYMHMVEETGKKTGDSGILSDADKSIIALALDLGAVLLTDDFAVANLCIEMGIEFMPVKNRKINKKFKRVPYCPNCMKPRKSKICDICGAKTKPKVVRIEDINNTC